MALAKIHPGLVMVRHAGKDEQPESAQGQGEDQDVPRPDLGMRQGALQRFGRSAVDRERQDPDMAPLPLASLSGDDPGRSRDPCAGLGGLGTDGMQAGARRVSEGEVRIGRDCLVQGLRSTGPAERRRSTPSR